MEGEFPTLLSTGCPCQHKGTNTDMLQHLSQEPGESHSLSRDNYTPGTQQEAEGPPELKVPSWELPSLLNSGSTST